MSDNQDDQCQREDDPFEIKPVPQIIKISDTLIMKIQEESDRHIYTFIKSKPFSIADIFK